MKMMRNFISQMKRMKKVMIVNKEVRLVKEREPQVTV